MFPLPGVVLFPTVYLPLHVFEPRYRALVRDCLANDREFGVSLIQSGMGDAGEDGPANVGCIARIVSAEEQTDGRFVLGSVGTRRFMVDEWLPDDPYPRAAIFDWEDPPAESDLTETRAGAVAAVRRVLAIATEAGLSVPPVGIDIDPEPIRASYQLAAISPLRLSHQLELLAAPDPATRYRRLGELLEIVEASLRDRLMGA